MSPIQRAALDLADRLRAYLIAPRPLAETWRVVRLIEALERLA